MHLRLECCSCWTTPWATSRTRTSSWPPSRLCLLPSSFIPPRSLCKSSSGALCNLSVWVPRFGGFTLAPATTQIHWQERSLSTESSRQEKTSACFYVLGPRVWSNPKKDSYSGQDQVAGLSPAQTSYSNLGPRLPLCESSCGVDSPPGDKKNPSNLPSELPRTRKLSAVFSEQYFPNFWRNCVFSLQRAFQRSPHDRDPHPPGGLPPPHAPHAVPLLQTPALYCADLHDGCYFWISNGHPR